MISEVKYFDKVEYAKQIIEEANKRSKHSLIVNFSGGKDSCCVLSLALDVTDNVECLFMSSSIDLPGSIDFVERQCKKFGVKLHITDPARDYQGDFSYWVRKFGYFPATGYTWCTSRLKLRPARAYFRKLYGRDALYKLTGVRKEESSRRAKIYGGKDVFEEDYEHSGSYMVHPILEWTDNDVKKFLKSINFEINENYKPCGVSGCYYCPFYQVEIYENILRTYPNIYDDIIALEKEIGKPSVSGNKYLWKIKERVKGQTVLSDWL